MADEQTTAEPLPRPANSASKAEWVAYGDQEGVDTSGTRDDIRALIDERDAAVPSAETSTEDAPVEEQSAGQAEEQSVEPERTQAPPPDVTFPAQPVHTFTIGPSEDEPIRAGGHILTDRGWVVEETGEPVASEEDGEES